MPPKTSKINIEDLSEAILDSKIVESLAKALSPLITLSIEECLSTRLSALASQLDDIKRSHSALAVHADELTKENVSLRKQLKDHASRLDDLEAHSRADSLIIKGLPEQSYAESATMSSSSLSDAPNSASANPTSYLAVESTVISFCKDTLKVDVSTSDISSAHRLRVGPHDKVRPIIVRFANRRKKDEVYRAKKTLKNHSNIYISEQLTKSASSLFFEARKLLREKKIHSTWTQNGVVYVKFTANMSIKPTIVKCLADLNPQIVNSSV